MIAVTIAQGLAYQRMADLAAASVRRFTGLDATVLAADAGTPAAWQKLLLLRRYPGETVMYFDADTRFLRPWDLTPYDDQQAVFAVADLPSRARNEDCLRYPMRPGRYLNSGLWIANSRHADVWDLAYSLVTAPEYKTSFRFEQTAWNVALQRTRTPIQFLSATYNWICSPEHVPANDVTVLHLAGGGLHSRNRLIFERALRDGRDLSA